MRGRIRRLFNCDCGPRPGMPRRFARSHPEECEPQRHETQRRPADKRKKRTSTEPLTLFLGLLCLLFFCVSVSSVVQSGDPQSPEHDRNNWPLRTPQSDRRPHGGARRGRRADGHEASYEPPRRRSSCRPCPLTPPPGGPPSTSPRGPVAATDVNALRPSCPPPSVRTDPRHGGLRPAVVRRDRAAETDFASVPPSRPCASRDATGPAPWAYPPVAPQMRSPLICSRSFHAQGRHVRSPVWPRTARGRPVALTKILGTAPTDQEERFLLEAPGHQAASSIPARPSTRWASIKRQAVLHDEFIQVAPSRKSSPISAPPKAGGVFGRLAQRRTHELAPSSRRRARCRGCGSCNSSCDVLPGGGVRHSRASSSRPQPDNVMVGGLTA